MEALAWILIAATLAVSLGLDLLAHRGDRGASTRNAAVWSAIWIGLGAGFGVAVGLLRGGAALRDYYATYLIEESLSIDNLFVFLVIFQGLAIPLERQRTVLFFGVLGALVFRGLFVLAGSAALERWRGASLVFGGILLVAGLRAMKSNPAQGGDSRIVRWLSRRLPVSGELSGSRFLVRQSGRTLATPLLVALVALELSDVVFAVDSVPAALSVSHDRFVVYASNALAICGLRSLYLVLGRVIGGLPYLHFGIGSVLLFTAFKLITQAWFETPAWLTIVVTSACIGTAVATSLCSLRRRTLVTGA
jgi:tellurite resistance protein TerC